MTTASRVPFSYEEFLLQVNKWKPSCSRPHGPKGIARPSVFNWGKFEVTHTHFVRSLKTRSRG